jgi:hypothetical protein
VAIETQTNGILLPNMLHAFAQAVSSEVPTTRGHDGLFSGPASCRAGIW